MGGDEFLTVIKPSNVATHGENQNSINCIVVVGKFKFVCHCMSDYAMVHLGAQN